MTKFQSHSVKGTQVIGNIAKANGQLVQINNVLNVQLWSI